MARENTGTARPPSLLLAAALFAAVAGYTGSSGTSGGPEPERRSTGAGGADSAKAAKVESLPTASPKDPRRAFQEFWEASKPDEGKELAQELFSRSGAIAPEFLIALVPDPIDSRLSYRFDGVVDDVQMAVEALGWNLDRFWLPWQPSGQQPPTHDVLKPTVDSPPDPGKAFSGRLRQAGGLTGRYGLAVEPDKSQPQGSALHEREPGVLLFRKPRTDKDSKVPQQLLTVFLVGERPTSGVHKAALGKALNIIDFVRRKSVEPGVPTDDEIAFPIVGPYFSGSQRSLEMAIADWTARRLETAGGRPVKKGVWQFRVRSGGANNIDKQVFETNAGHAEEGPCHVKFDATLHHFDHIMAKVFEFLLSQNGGRRLGKVALLTESDTQFGKVGAKSETAPQSGKADTKSGANGSRDILATKWHLRGDHAPITLMTFPFHISQVAIAYDQSRQANEKAAAPSLARPSSKLRIPFDETGQPRDVVPSLSPAMSSASDEFDLAKILETIALEDYRYVGIVATDTRDVIFLAALVREYCPDVQLFTPVGDLLLGHPTYAAQLRGTLVASTYPLFSLAQRWDPPYEGDHRRHLFMHETDQGYYNAALSLLGTSGKPAPGGDEATGPRSTYYVQTFDYAPPFGELDDYAVPRQHNVRGDASKSQLEDSVPPIWIGVVGQRGLWPLHYYSALRAERDEQSDPIFQPRDEDLQTSNPDEEPSEKARRQLDLIVPLVPQLVWLWGTIALGLAVLTYGILLTHWGMALGDKPPGGVLSLLRMIVPGTEGARLRDAQDRLVYALIGVVGVVFGYFVVKPCDAMVRHSPWRAFFVPHRMAALTQGDFWNWLFGLLATVLAGAGVTALAAAVVIRFRLAADQGSPAPARAVRQPSSTARDGVAWVWDHRWFLLPAVVLGWFAAAPFLDLTYCGRDLAVRLGHAAIMAAAVLAIVLLAESAKRSKDVLKAKVDAAAQAARVDGPNRAAWQAEWERGSIRLNRGPLGYARSSIVLAALVPLLAGALMLGWELAIVPLERPYDSLLFLERALNLGNGVSPLVPALLAGLAAATWLGCQSRRVLYLDRHWKDRIGPGRALPFDQDIDGEAVRERKARLLHAGETVRDLLVQAVPGALTRNLACVLAVGLALLVLTQLLERYIPVVDGLAYNTTMVLLFALLIVLTVLTLCRFVLVWWAVRRVLREFALLPMQRAFDRIPHTVSREFGPYLNASEPTVKNLELTARQWALVADGYPGDDAVQGLCEGLAHVPPEQRRRALDELARDFRGPDAPEGAHDGPAARIMRLFERECVAEMQSAPQAGREIRRLLRRAGGACLSVLIPHWQSRSIDDGYGEGPVAAQSGPESASPSDPLKRWLMQAEDLLALELVNFVRECTLHLKNQAVYLAVGPLLLLLAVTSYPFQPQRFLVLIVWGLLVAVAAGVLWVYVQMERNEVLSRVAKTTPDRITFSGGFLGHAAVALVPLLGALLTQFPYVSDSLNQWLDPLVRILK